jgi:methionyl-tRNA formyltransferase
MGRLRLAFMGTPDFAVPTLQALLAAGHEIAAVYTQPPRPAGRGHKDQPSPVHRLAEAHGLEVRTPERLKGDEEKAAFAALDLDFAVVAAYGLILPKAILAAPRHGCVNVHGSLLPRWRGAAPIQRALLAGDEATGITIMRMEAGLDTGPMVLTRSVPIGPRTTAAELHDALAAIGAQLIVPAIEGLAAGSLAGRTQPEEGVTYAAKIEREEGRIAWREAEVVDRQVRALNPHPGTWFEHAGERIKVLAAEPASDASAAGAPAGTVLDDRLTVACADGGAIRPTRLQRPGKAPMPAGELLRGYAIPPGAVL